MNNSAEKLVPDTGYTVVARRYRPRSFQELIGQSHISQALERAIELGRVGHAYLFTGARGVGKTSTARIFAKALNLPKNSSAADGADASSSAHRDDASRDIERAIDAGEDIDVIEIDGASNRGIEEIRQLRANVNVRPSRSPYKIYIIDEVHMLTGPAFNALLKTLEEPPPHVKFIFCTTDPDKIPITVLSRCQRFDFAPVRMEAIQSRLQEIAEKEGYEVDQEALALLARRSAGSMRDSQSLLEQVMSFCDGRISVDQVHQLLGTADESRLTALVEAMIAKDPKSAIELVDASIRGGTDAGQLAEQLLNYLRDILAIGIGGGPDLLKIANPSGIEQLNQLATSWGTQSLLASLQILDECLVRMRTSVSAVTLLEVALVQICQLEQLASIPELLERIGELNGSAASQPANPQKKNVRPPSRHLESGESTQPGLAKATDFGRSSDFASAASETPVRTADEAEIRSVAEAHSPTPPGSEAVGGSVKAPLAESGLTVVATPSDDASPNSIAGEGAASQGDPMLDSVSGLAHWKQAIASLDGLLGDYASVAQAVRPLGSERWQVVFPAGAVQPKEYCERSDNKAQLQAAVEKLLGRPIGLQFEVPQGQPVKPEAPLSNSALRAQKLREMSNHPYVKRLCEVLDGEIVRVDPGRESLQPNGQSSQTSKDVDNSLPGKNVAPPASTP
ncbi:MAG: DNA polymerase III subunit gamma/tau [bacterium]|nr:DNA polymerase III subunit gamma/tau [bacterium]